MVRWAQLIEAMHSSALKRVKQEVVAGGTLGGGGLAVLKALHKDLKDTDYGSNEIKDALDSTELRALMERDPLNVREETDGLEDTMDEVDQEMSEETHSVDAMYYDMDYPKVGKYRKKHKRKDYSAMVPPRGLRRSGHLRACKQSKLPSFVDLDYESA